MSEMPTAWSQEGYGDIVGAARSGADLEVEFANGDLVVVPAAQFGLTGSFEVTAEDEDGLSVRVTRESGPAVVVAWTQLRSAADPAFAQELRRRETEEARRLGLRLRALREDKDLSQRDVANLVGMSAPQLSKIESGSMDLRVSTVQSLLRAMGASLSDIAGTDAPEVSHKTVLKSAERAGVPRDVVSALLANGRRSGVARLVERAFGWHVDDLIAGHIAPTLLPAGVAFKATRVGKDPGQSPLVLLGRTISDIVRRAASVSEYAGLPSSGTTVNAEARDRSGQVTLPSLAAWAWARGIPVVPMLGRGDFSAAVWNDLQPPVILLKESRELAVYWLFDLAHELGHLALAHVGTSGLVDVESPASRRDSSDQTERDADRFALNVLMPDHEQLLREVRRQAQGSHLRFKGAVASVADAAKVNAGTLGMIAAYELTEVGQDKDRWGSATNLARPDGAGRDHIQQVARQYLSPNKLDDLDVALVRQLVLSPEH